MSGVPNSGLIARQWAVDGHGRIDVAADLAAGRLLQVLPGVISTPYPLVLALARGTHMSARVRMLGDFLQARLRSLVDGLD